MASSAASASLSATGIAPAPTPEALKGPITLPQALQLAFEYSPTLRAARSQVESAHGTVAAARARFNPTFTIAAVRLGEGGIDSDLMASAPAAATSAELSIVLPLDISRALKYATNLASSQFRMQYLSMVAVSEGLIVSVKRAYYDLLRACGQEAVAQSAVDNARVSLDNIRAKHEEGTVAQFDVTSAEVERENLNQQLIAARNEVMIAQAAFNGVLGVDVNYPTQIIADDVTVGLTTVDVPQSVNAAYTRRPDLQATRIAVAAAQTNVGLQRSALRPSLSLSGGPSYDPDGTGVSTGDYSWQVVAAVSMPIWDGGVAKAEVHAAEADVCNARATLDQSALSVAQQVRTAALNLQEAALRTQTTARAVALAEEALSLANVRYDAGIAVLVEVTNAQTQLTEAQNNHVNARYDYAIALAELEKATSSQPELKQLQMLTDPTLVTSPGNGVRP